MQQETIARHINGLGKADFDAVVTLLFQKVFKLKAVNVDGPGDGGSDMRCFETARERRVLASQVTVTDKAWKQKAIEDAEKAVRELAATQFYFLTSRRHSSGDLRKLELEIQSEIGIPAVCMGANEIAGLIREEDIVRDFVDVICLPVDVPIRSRPDKQEILLHAFAALSDERKSIREAVYDDALLVTAFDIGAAVSRQELVPIAAELLGLTTESHKLLDRRVDSCLGESDIKRRRDRSVNFRSSFSSCGCSFPRLGVSGSV